MCSNIRSYLNNWKLNISDKSQKYLYNCEIYELKQIQNSKLLLKYLYFILVSKLKKKILENLKYIYIFLNYIIIVY